MKVNTYFHLVRKYRMSGALPPLRGVRMNNFTSLDVKWFFCDSAEHYLNVHASSHTVNSAKTNIDFFGIVIPLCLIGATQHFEHYAFIYFLPSSDRITITYSKRRSVLRWRPPLHSCTSTYISGLFFPIKE